ncbi:MAG: hypothetical protein MMC33_004785 [Icmadophila ericetorum]|nr:hypothetical protein [Icmadophila ericetorum]
MVQMLLDYEADVNLKGGENGYALIAAVSAGHMDVYYGNTLTVASICGNKAMVQLLLEKGAAFDGGKAIRDTALMVAASQGFTEVVELLLDKCADINAQNQADETALCLAAAGGETETVQPLLSRGASSDLQENCYDKAKRAAFKGWGEPEQKLVVLKLLDEAEERQYQLHELRNWATFHHR